MVIIACLSCEVVRSPTVAIQLKSTRGFRFRTFDLNDPWAEMQLATRSTTGKIDWLTVVGIYERAMKLW